MTAEQLLALLPAERKNVRLLPRRRGHYRDRNRERLPQDQLVDFLKAHKIKTTVDLRKHREKNTASPMIHDYIAAFGSWKAAVERAFGKSILTQPPPNDPAYIAKCAVQFDAWTQARYLAVRRLMPNVVPSARQVRRVWGNFGNMFFAARRMSAQKTLEDYLALERRLGRIPTAKECRAVGLDLSPLNICMGTKWEIDDLLRYRLHADKHSKAC